MNANQIAFGIEFETTLPNSDTTPIGPYHHGYQVPWLPTGWRAERDASIKPETPNRKGCEFVSPKLKGYEGLKQIEDAIDKINEHDAKVNASCGLYITIEWNGDAAALARLISLVGKLTEQLKSMRLNVCLGIVHRKGSLRWIAFVMQIDDHTSRDKVATDIRRISGDAKQMRVLGADFLREA